MEDMIIMITSQTAAMTHQKVGRAHAMALLMVTPLASSRIASGLKVHMGMCMSRLPLKDISAMIACQAIAIILHKVGSPTQCNR